ncbi:hypothetical protein [Streptomyces purpurascens]
MTPTATAVSSGDSAIGFRAVWSTWADRIASRLARAGVRRGDRVGVLVEPSSTAMVAEIGARRPARQGGVRTRGSRPP